MPTINENLKIVTIRELLKENLTIPGYQRPYRWSTESAVTLVTDSYSAFINKVSILYCLNSSSNVFKSVLSDT